ncbi:MAG: hypothetical protein ACLP0J_21635 [Solirubrobacteraceae bacterium]
MQTGNRIRWRGLLGVSIAVAFAAVLLSACARSSGLSATTLLRQTFTGSHEISTGVVELTVSIKPSGSSLSGPIKLSFGGPFQSRGSGKLPASDFTASVSALGQSGSLGIISTGTSGYVTMSGIGYPLPPASFKKLESGFSGLGGSSARPSGGASGGPSGGALSGLGIDPLSWLQNPTVVGNGTVAGVATTHIHAGVNVAALLGNVSTLLSRRSGVGVKGIGKVPTSISPPERAQLAAAIRSPSMDVWAAERDKTLRKLEVRMTALISGRDSRELGGVTSLGIDVTLQYSDLNQPQAIFAPATIKPFRVLRAKLNSLMSELQER